IQEWPNQTVTARVHGPQASRACPPEEPQQERLSLIVARMAQRHDVGLELHPGPIQERVTRGPRGVFDRAVLLACKLADVRAIDDERSLQRFGQSDTKGLVAVRIGAQLVVEVRQTNE